MTRNSKIKAFVFLAIFFYIAGSIIAVNWNMFEWNITLRAVYVIGGIVTFFNLTYS